MQCGAPYTMRGRQGSCSCASHTSPGSSARTRSWPSVRGSSSSPKRTATSPPTTTGPARLDDDHLQAARVARRRDEAEPGQQLELAVDRLVARAGRLDPLADRVVVLRARVLELLPLNVHRPSGEEVVAAAVVEVQVRVDDDVDAGEVERLLAQWDEAGVKVGHLRVQLRHAGVDQDSGGGMVDDVDADRPALALDEQLGHEQRRDRGRRYHQSTSYRRYDSRREAKSSLRINRRRGLSTSELSMRLRRWRSERRERR